MAPVLDRLAARQITVPSVVLDVDGQAYACAVVLQGFEPPLQVASASLAGEQVQYVGSAPLWWPGYRGGVLDCVGRHLVGRRWRRRRPSGGRKWPVVVAVVGLQLLNQLG